MQASCWTCQSQFQAVRSNQHYCSPPCRAKGAYAPRCAVAVERCRRCAQLFVMRNHAGIASTCEACRPAEKRDANRTREQQIKALTGTRRAAAWDAENTDRVRVRQAEASRRRERVLPARQRYPESFRQRDQLRRDRLATAPEKRPYLREEIYARDQWICQLCAKPVDPTRSHPDLLCASIDHRIPIARGGADNDENVQLSHLICNIRKGTTIPA